MTGMVRGAKMVAGTEDEVRPVHRTSFACSDLWPEPEGAPIPRDLWLDLEILPGHLQFPARYGASKEERLLTKWVEVPTLPMQGAMVVRRNRGTEGLKFDLLHFNVHQKIC